MEIKIWYDGVAQISPLNQGFTIVQPGSWKHNIARTFIGAYIYVVWDWLKENYGYTGSDENCILPASYTGG